MATINELMAAGIPAAAASRIAQDVANTGLTATGTTQANSLALTSRASIFSTVGSGAGCVLGERGTYLIYNGGSNALLVWPPVGSSINNGSANASFSVAAGKSAQFTSNNLIYFANVSA